MIGMVHSVVGLEIREGIMASVGAAAPYFIITDNR